MIPHSAVMNIINKTGDIRKMIMKIFEIELITLGCFSVAKIHSDKTS